MTQSEIQKEIQIWLDVNRINRRDWERVYSDIIMGRLGNVPEGLSEETIKHLQSYRNQRCEFHLGSDTRNNSESLEQLLKIFQHQTDFETTDDIRKRDLKRKEGSLFVIDESHLHLLCEIAIRNESDWSSIPDPETANYRIGEIASMCIAKLAMKLDEYHPPKDDSIEIGE